MIIACPNCDNRFEIGSEYNIGCKYQCPVCGKNFIAQADNQAQAENPKDENSQNGFSSLANDSGFVPLESDNGGFVPIENEGNGSPASFQMNSDDSNDKARRLLEKYLARAESMSSAAKYILNNNLGRGVVIGLLGICLSPLYSPLYIIGLILKGFFDVLFSDLNITSKAIAAFHRLRQRDDSYLERLDMLSYVGKKESFLVAKPQTFFSPALKSSECRFVFAGENFIYSVSQITKIYVFAEQLVIVYALWDYTKGILFDEGSEAFFFKDITSISTQYGYEDKKNKIFNNFYIISFFLTAIGFYFLIRTLMLHTSIEDKIKIFNESYLDLKSLESLESLERITGTIGISLLILGLVFCIIWLVKLLTSAKTTKQKIRKSETLIITNSSGRSMEIPLLCNEWIQARNGKCKQRTSNEKIFHAIRKMVEEKKQEAANG